MATPSSVVMTLVDLQMVLLSTLDLVLAFVMIKRTDVGNGWEIHDTVRDPHNPSDDYLVANETSYSFSSSSELNFLK